MPGYVTGDRSGWAPTQAGGPHADGVREYALLEGADGRGACSAGTGICGRVRWVAVLSWGSQYPACPNEITDTCSRTRPSLSEPFRATQTAHWLTELNTCHSMSFGQRREGGGRWAVCESRRDHGRAFVCGEPRRIDLEIVDAGSMHLV